MSKMKKYKEVKEAIAILEHQMVQTQKELLSLVKLTQDIAIRLVELEKRCDKC